KLCVAAAVAVGAGACGGGGSPPTAARKRPTPASSLATLNFYNFPDPSGPTPQKVASPNPQSPGQYAISPKPPPAAAAAQRQQLARRLAAHDDPVDIMGLDVTWAAEFAEAGWILPWTGTNRQLAESDTLKPTLDTATWHGKLYAVPANTNTQLLWYRSDL